jgi:hypothetical protein
MMDEQTDITQQQPAPPITESDAPAAAASGEHVVDFCKKVRKVLPEAVAGSLTDDDRLANALYPTVERSVTRSVRKDSRPLVDAMFPILGPMIRRNIAETMRGMVQSLNRAVEYTFSVRGLKWRWEAFISGKSFAEVVMLHSLVYRVEQVFLIHKETGLLLLHVASEHVRDQENKENMVSAMLTAIQDFVKDSFSTEANSQLSSVQVGDLNVWLEQSGDVVVAGVVRGDLPPVVQAQLRETTEIVQAEMQEELDEFNGEVGPFERVRFDLENCLREQLNERMRLIPLTWVILIAPIIGLLWWAGLTTTENWQWGKYVRTVRSQPGLIVIEAGQREGDFTIIGMRDALAADPEQLLKKHPLIAHQVKSQWMPYQSLHPDFVMKRISERLKPPTSVSLKLKDGRLTVSGSAPHTWIETFDRVAFGLPGVVSIDKQKLTNADARITDAWQDCVRRLRASPGIVVTRAEADGLSFMLEGMRDPLAADPATLINDYPELNSRVQTRWATHYAVVPGFVLKRAHAILTPPESVTLDVDQQNRLRIAGHAKRDWIERTRIVAPTIAGVGSIDDSDLHDMDGHRYREWQRYLQLLDEAPGLVVLEHDERDGVFHLLGFQDPLGSDPYAILETVGLSKNEVKTKWLPSPDASKRFVLSHAQRVLAPPPSVTLQRVEDTLIATGSAPHDWIREASIIARCLPGITAFQTDLLVDEDVETLDRLRYEVERVLIICSAGDATPASGQDTVISRLVSTIGALHATALKLNTDLAIAVVGESDTALTDGRRQSLARQRADTFASLLEARGVPPQLLLRETSTAAARSEGLAGVVGFSRKRGVSLQVRTVAPDVD